MKQLIKHKGQGVKTINWKLFTYHYGFKAEIISNHSNMYIIFIAFEIKKLILFVFYLKKC